MILVLRRVCHFQNRPALPLLLHHNTRPFNTSPKNQNVSKPSASASWNIKLPTITSKQILKEMLPLIWPKNDWKTRLKVCTALSLLLGGKVLNVQVPMLFKQIVDKFNEISPIATEIPSHFLSIQSSFTVAGTVLLGYVAARLGSSLFSELRNVVFASVAQRTIRQAALSVFSHLLRLDHNFHARVNPGGLSRVIDRGIKGINFSFTALLFNIVPTVVEIGLVCGVMTHAFGPSYALVTAGMMGTYSVFTSRVTQWRTRFRREMNTADSEASVRAYDSLLHQETVKNFCKEAWEGKTYNSALLRYEAAALDTTRSLFWLNFGQQAVLSVALTTVMTMAGGGIVHGVNTIGDLVMLNTLIFQLSLPLNFLGSVYRELKQSLVDMEALFGLKRLEPHVKDDILTAPLTVPTGAISFKNVSFSYGPDSPRLLNNISFSIPGGKKVAFVGPSGSGKSTIARLLLHHVEPVSGTIQIDKQDISKCSLSSLRGSVGIVTQDTILFNNSLHYNIAYGSTSQEDPSKVPREEVERVARMAALHDQFISKLPSGYDTRVGERGVMLSGGEKQRISIARLLLKNPPIMIFDESTSALDSQTESSILTSLKSLSASSNANEPSNRAKTTMIFIAHRLSTIMDADCIYVIENGQLIQSGTHEELLQDTASLYYRLWTQQGERDNKD